jgi:hypothetical protein
MIRYLLLIIYGVIPDKNLLENKCVFQYKCHIKDSVWIYKTCLLNSL